MVAVTLRMFAGAREAAGVGRESFEAHSVSDVLEEACERFGPGFSEILGISRVWLNGEAVVGEVVLDEGDEIAVLPPVSGGR